MCGVPGLAVSIAHRPAGDHMSALSNSAIAAEVLESVLDPQRFGRTDNTETWGEPPETIIAGSQRAESREVSTAGPSILPRRSQSHLHGQNGHGGRRRDPRAFAQSRTGCPRGAHSGRMEASRNAGQVDVQAVPTRRYSQGDHRETEKRVRRAFARLDERWNVVVWMQQFAERGGRLDAGASSADPGFDGRPGALPRARARVDIGGNHLIKDARVVSPCAESPRPRWIGSQWRCPRVSNADAVHEIGVPALPLLLALFNRFAFVCWIGPGAKLGRNVSLGYGGMGSVIHDKSVIGDQVRIGTQVVPFEDARSARDRRPLRHQHRREAARAVRCLRALVREGFVFAIVAVSRDSIELAEGLR